VSKAIVPQRLIIYGAQGKVRGVIENRVLRKEICGRIHLLRKPPAIALDARMYDRYRPYFDEIEITDADTGIVYRVAASYFDRRRFEIERGYGKQYALGLKRWHTNTPTGEQLLLEVWTRCNACSVQSTGYGNWQRTGATLGTPTKRNAPCSAFARRCRRATRAGLPAGSDRPRPPHRLAGTPHAPSPHPAGQVAHAHSGRRGVSRPRACAEQGA
jgi:hypothetical protein